MTKQTDRKLQDELYVSPIIWYRQLPCYHEPLLDSHGTPHGKLVIS